MSELLSVESVACAYGKQRIVEAVSFRIREGEIACLLGPSGCGKTTLLRALAGFNGIAEGQIRLLGQAISTPTAVLAPEKRKMGMVFQDYALFPHLTVAENIAFGLKTLSRTERRARVLDMLALVRLPDLSDRYPHELSGGQQQRVALARALAPRPQLLLMDEPFSNLDTEMRKELSLEVRDIIKQQGIAAVVVTHDQEEAFVISDAVGILANGRLQQWGSAEALYYNPQSIEIARFVGDGDLIDATLLAENRVETELGVLEFAEPLAVNAQALQLFIRPVDISPVACQDAGCCPRAKVTAREFMGEATRYRLQLPSGKVVTATARELLPIRVGDEVGVQVAAHRPIAFPVAH